VNEICEKADILVVVGTKLETGLSSSLVSNAIRRGIKVVEVNPEPYMECGNILQLPYNAE
jgi:NAD-dependent SIR2 family protein deacetylase